MTKNEKRQTIVSVSKDVEKLECSYIAGGIVKWHNHFGNSLAVLLPRKVNMESSYNSAIPLLGVYPGELKTYVHTKTSV